MTAKLSGSGFILIPKFASLRLLRTSGQCGSDRKAAAFPNPQGLKMKGKRNARPPANA